MENIGNGREVALICSFGGNVNILQPFIDGN